MDKQSAAMARDSMEVFSEWPWEKSGDGFFVCTTSLADMLLSRGIRDTGLSQKNSEDTVSYYDDWYLYAVTEGTVVYSLVKMREQEHDYVPGFSDRDDPGVTVSFVPFDPGSLVQLLLGETSPEVLTQFVEDFRRATEYRGQSHGPSLQRYFSRPESEGPYVIAKAYLEKLRTQITDGVFPFPEDMVNASRRLLTGLRQYNAAAEREIVDFPNRCIRVQDPEQLTQLEADAIFAVCTGDLSLSSFAAEVQFHAEALVHLFAKIPFFGRKYWYASAVRADMGVDRELLLYTMLMAPYYHRHSALMRAQVRAHGYR